MRVVHLLRKYDPSEWGGTETAIEQLTSGLARHRVESIVYSPRLPNRVTDLDPLNNAGCVTRQFGACVPVWGISAARKRQMIAVGGNVVSFDLLGSLCLEKGIDLVHSHALGRLGAIGRAAARVRGVPFVLSVHGGAYDLPSYVRRELQVPASGGWDWGKPLGLLLGARKLFSQADAIVTCNVREAALIRERHPDRRVIVQPHGVPAAPFAENHRAAALAAFPMIAGRDVLFMPGRIDPVKNQGWLISQAAELARRHPKALFVFAGACTDRVYGEAIQKLITDEGVAGSVLLAGKLPPGDPRLIGLMQSARAVVLPSVSETFGLIILEAWAAGTPVISSRTSGANALVEEGENGFLFDLDQPAAFHAAVDQLLKRPELRARLGAAGRARVVADYDTGVLSARMKLLYDHLVEEKHALRHSA
jgi:glycosyltransferase involved in cell wall biosynthesis